MDLKHYHKILSSGHKLLLIPIKDIKMFQLEIFYGVGLHYMTDMDKLELPHFLEHLYTKLTSNKYPSAQKNKSALELRGIIFNGHTGKYETWYEYQGQSKYLEYLLDLVLNCLSSFEIDREIIESEKSAVVNELMIKSGRSELSTKTELFIRRRSHIKGSTFEKRIKSVGNITIEDVVQFKNKYYSGRNCVIALSGDFNPKVVYKSIKSHLSKYNHLDSIYPLLPKVHIPLHRPRGIYLKDNDKMCDLNIIFFNYFTVMSRDMDTIRLIHGLLCGTRDSILMRKLRNEKKYVYNISISHFTEKDNFGFELIKTNVEHKNIVDTVKTILEEIKKFKHELIDNDEIFKTKNTLLNSFYQKTYSGLDEKIEDVVNYYLWDKPVISNKQRKSKIQNIDQTIIRNIAKLMFVKSRVLITYSSPVNYNKEIEKLFPKSGITFLEKN